VTELSHVGEARRIVAALANLLEFDETAAGKAAIVVTELANNLVRHAKEGELIVRPLQADGVGGIELIAMDRGPGMGNVPRALSDGFSTGGTPGNGMGAIVRQSDGFDLHSEPAGTVLCSVLWAKPQASAGTLDCGVICVPKPGELVCGDAWAMDTQNGRQTIMVADGLGHGAAAADASRQAVRVFSATPKDDLPRLIQALHGGLRATRGAAVAVAVLDRGRNEMRFIGVGNISGTIVSSSGTKSMVSHNGTVGAEVRRSQEFTYSWPADGILVLHSDGLSTQWHIEKHPGLFQRRSSVIAGVLHRDHRRIRDDATVLVVRQAVGQ
jgi:anti-sigma regulatory factor (Ser/Thr protein kinase)